MPKKSQYRGVYWDGSVNAWAAVFYLHMGKRCRKIDLGHYPDETEAAKAYDAEVRRRYGDRAVTNFPVVEESASAS